MLSEIKRRSDIAEIVQTAFNCKSIQFSPRQQIDDTNKRQSSNFGDRSGWLFHGN